MNSMSSCNACRLCRVLIRSISRHFRLFTRFRRADNSALTGTASSIAFMFSGFCIRCRRAFNSLDNFHPEKGGNFYFRFRLLRLRNSDSDLQRMKSIHSLEQYFKPCLRWHSCICSSSLGFCICSSRTFNSLDVSFTPKKGRVRGLRFPLLMLVRLLQKDSSNL